MLLIGFDIVSPQMSTSGDFLEQSETLVTRQGPLHVPSNCGSAGGVLPVKVELKVEERRNLDDSL